VGLAIWPDVWADDLLDDLPPNIVRALDTLIVCALLRHCCDLGAQMDDLKQLFEAMKQQAEERGQ
jgi:hypothetical protein